MVEARKAWGCSAEPPAPLAHRLERLRKKVPKDSDAADELWTELEAHGCLLSFWCSDAYAGAPPCGVIRAASVAMHGLGLPPHCLFWLPLIMRLHLQCGT